MDSELDFATHVPGDDTKTRDSSSRPSVVDNDAAAVNSGEEYVQPSPAMASAREFSYYWERPAEMVFPIEGDLQTAS
jgi:uncharacterized protein YfaQ (DUF2300 family)